MVNLQDFERAGYDFFKGFTNAASDSLSDPNVGDRIASSIAQTTKRIFTDIAANAKDPNELGQQIGSQFAAFARSAAKSTGWNSGGAGSEIGSGVNEFLRKLVKDINLKTVTGDFMSEFSDAFKEGVTKMDMADNMSHLSSEFDEGMSVFRKNLFGQLDILRSDIQSIFSNIARDTTLKTLPWVALGGTLLVGTPLLTMYVYKKAIHDIGRPKLAQEIRKVGLLNRASDGVARTVSSIWVSAVTGVKWSALVGGAGLALTIAGTAASEIMRGNSGYGGEVLEGLSCAMGRGPYYCSSRNAFPLIAATVGAGVLRAGASLASNLYDFVRKKMNEKNYPPIFSDELQKRIDNLTQATYNISRNGGYMQNLLLYGPGGTGKTMISKYIAKNSNMNYVMMSGGDLAQFIKRGEHVTELNNLFESIKNSQSPTILFIDECESLCGDRGKMDRSELIELVNGFLNHTGEASKKIMIILTTNRKDDLDPAVLSRMDHKLYIGPPQEKERKKIIDLYLPAFMTPSEREQLFTDEMVTNIAKQTEGFTGRTIFKMFNTMSSMRAATQNNTLTKQMVADTVSTFVKQEADIVRKTA